MQVLTTVFPGRLISVSGTATGPPGLAVLDCCVKSNVYGTGAANIGDLKRLIRERTPGTPKETLQRVMITFPSLLQDCIERLAFLSPTKCRV